MSQRYRIEMAGCTPEPLMSYLKALGVLRLVSEQADSEALGSWERDVFVLESWLDLEEVERFFLEEYRPTPIVGPWAGGSGFFGNDNRSAVEAIAASSVARLDAYRAVIAQVVRILSEEGLTEKPSGEQKAALLRRYRREMPDPFLDWMDACMSLGEQAEWYAPVLGTGGNDGRLDFTQNFMQRLVGLGLGKSMPVRACAALLEASLRGYPTGGLGKSAVGQFSPGRAGGPNATQGMEAGSLDNPWDYVLALEGALMLSSAAVKRLRAGATGRGAFPFTVTSRPVGDGESSEGEAQEARGELWLPLWNRPASGTEVRTLFSEGRAELGRRPARDAVDFSRAVAGLGTDRGIQAFARYAMLKRSGKSFLAVATERFAVPEAIRENVELIAQVDRWLDELRLKTRSDGPARLQAAVRRVESAIFAYCKHGRRADMLELIVALGRTERELAVTAGKRGNRVICPPLHTLPNHWIDAVRDDSVEFEIALALAGIHGLPGPDSVPALPIRTNLEAVRALNGARWGWDEATPSVVWTPGGLVSNLSRVLARRLLDGGATSLASNHGVRLSSVARFLAGEVDDRRIEELLWGLALVDTKGVPGVQSAGADDAPRPHRAYALLKPLFLPQSPVFVREAAVWRYDRGAEAGRIQLESRILPLLRANRAKDACEIARRRLMVSGFPPLAGAEELGEAVNTERLAAALLLPIHDRGLNALMKLIVHPPVLELQE